MYGIILTSVFLIIALIEGTAIVVLINKLSDFSLKLALRIKHIIRAAILIEITVFNFLFSFVDPIIVFQLILQITINVVSLTYFFFDIFYFSQKTRTYLLWLQSEVFGHNSVYDIFRKIKYNGEEFKEKKAMPQQRIYVVNAGSKKGKCIYVPSSDGGFLLKPKVDLDERTLLFYAQKIEMDLEEKRPPLLHKGTLPTEAASEYDFGKESKIYLWIRDKLLSIKGKTIIAFVIIGSIMILCLTIGILSFNGFDIIDDFLAKPLSKC